MQATLTIRLDKKLSQMLSRFSRKSNRNRSELVRDALRRQLSVLVFDQLRAEALPHAESAGYLTDDDVFRDIS